MARHLYRFYLYIVFIALLIFATVAIGRLLNTLFLLTPLRGSYETAPAASEVIQSTIFTLVSLLIAGLLAGLHYWLIRRDMDNDPTAGSSSIRSLFLNLTEAISIIIAVPVFGFGVLNPLGSSTSPAIVSAMATTLSILILVGLLEIERRRTTAASGLATTFQRLHFYGVQLLFLIFLSISWWNTLMQVIAAIFFAGRGTNEICTQYTSCNEYRPLFLILTMLWFLGCWLLSGWATRNDRSAVLRLIVQYISLAAGIGFLIAALFQIVQILFLNVFHLAPSLADVLGPYASNNFIAPMVIGILIILVTHYWLERAMRVGIIPLNGLAFIEYTFIAILAGGTFWCGCGDVLYQLLERLSTTTAFDGRVWATALGLVIAGVGYIPFDLSLWRSNRQGKERAASPRRGLVLALLAGGILAFAIGAAVALYAWITELLGSAIANWQQTMHAGLAACIVGALLVIIYLRAARQENLFTATKKQAPEPAAPMPATTEPATTIEEILDELLAGKISREAAASQLRQLQHSQEQKVEETENISG